MTVTVDQDQMKRTFNQQKASKAILAAAQMPPLHHKLPDQEFDVSRSQVIDWLCQQPEIRQSIFSHFSDHGAIVFDTDSSTWHGVLSQ